MPVNAKESATWRTQFSARQPKQSFSVRVIVEMYSQMRPRRFASEHIQLGKRDKEISTVQMLSAAEFAAQTVLELPDRDLLDATITITGNHVDVSVLEDLLNHSFDNWSISALNGNTVTVNVIGNLSQNDLDVFCNQVVAVASAQCDAQLI